MPWCQCRSSTREWRGGIFVSATRLKVFKATFIEEFEDLLGQNDFLRRWMVPDEFWNNEKKEGIDAFT